MKKTKLALAISTSLIAATPAMATNGDNLIGLGAQSRALGGTGVAAFYGSENALANPALLAKAKGNEISFGGTLFKPSVKSDNGNGSRESTADTNVIPEVSVVNPINDHLSFGIGMFGSAGMGVDYRKQSINPMNANTTYQDSLFDAQSNLQLMKFAPSLSYKSGSFGVGFAPVLQYGALDINYIADNDNNPSTAGVHTTGSGTASDLGAGFNLGGFFDFKDLTIGLSFQSAIDMKYKNQISNAGAGLGMSFSDHLEQPAEIAIGIAYTMKKILLTADFKQIKWGDAKGYKDFKWENQNVIALGAKYQGHGYWLGAGFNKGDNPIKEQNGTTTQGAKLNMFNNLFFPATVESHITLGGGYRINKTVAIDAAIVKGLENTTTVDIRGLGLQNNKTSHSQTSYTISARYDF